MSRLSVPLAATFTLLLCSLALSQTNTGSTPTSRPGSVTGDALPGAATVGPHATQTQTGRIRGRVVAAQTGAPLRRAQVTLGVPVAQARSTLTDSEGRFEFAQLRAGRYAILASKTGFITLQNGQRSPTDVTDFIALADGEWRDDVELALPRGGVIAVRVTDDFGEPLPDVQVQVQRYQYGPDGERRLNSVFVLGAIGQSATDDRGDVRMYGLAPGEYIVSAMLRNQVRFNTDLSINDGFAVTYHPGTINPAEAQNVTVSLAEETSIEFAMSSTRRTRVSGSVVDSQGRPAAGSYVSAMTRQGNGMYDAAGGTVAPDGSFTINGVAAGDYSLDVRTQPQLNSSEGFEFGTTPIVVANTEITGVRIVTSRGTTISGRVIFEGTVPILPAQATTGQPAPLRILPTPADPFSRFVGPMGLDANTNGVIGGNGTFQIAGVHGRVFLVAGLPPGWTIKSVSLDGEDITDQPLDVTGKPSVTGLVVRITDKTTEISGRVSDARVFERANARSCS